MLGSLSVIFKSQMSVYWSGQDNSLSLTININLKGVLMIMMALWENNLHSRNSQSQIKSISFYFFVKDSFVH